MTHAGRPTQEDLGGARGVVDVYGTPLFVHITVQILGACARAYRRCGGFTPLSADEDVSLVRSLQDRMERSAASEDQRTTGGPCANGICGLSFESGKIGQQASERDLNPHFGRGLSVWSAPWRALPARIALTESIVTRGLALTSLTAGTQVPFGDDAVVEITSLRTPCVKIERSFKGLRQTVTEPLPGGGEVVKNTFVGIVKFFRPKDAPQTLTGVLTCYGYPCDR